MLRACAQFMLMNIDDWFLNRILIGSLYGFMGVILSPRVTSKLAPDNISNFAVALRNQLRSDLLFHKKRLPAHMKFEAIFVVCSGYDWHSLHAGGIFHTFLVFC